MAIAGAKGLVRDQLRVGGVTKSNDSEQDNILYFSVEDAVFGRPARRSFQVDSVNSVQNPLTAAVGDDSEEEEDKALIVENSGIDIRTLHPFHDYESVITNPIHP